MKKYLPNSLLGRTILIILVPVLLLQIAVSVVFFDRHWSEMTERLAFAVTGEMIAAANLIEESPNNMLRMEKIEQIVKDTLDLEMRFYTYVEYTANPSVEQAQNWLSNPFDRIEKDLTRQLQRRTDFKFNIMNRPDEKKVVVDLYLSEGVLEFTIPERRLFSSSSYIFILWMIGLSILLFTIAMLFMRNQIRPIYRLGVIAERLGRGVSVGKIKPSGAREVRQAAEAFINMQERINQFVEQRTLMLAAVSHDLKTPLTRMKLQLEMIEDNEDKNAMKKDIADMEDMIKGYLSFAKGDEGEEMQRLSLADFYMQLQADAKRLGLLVEVGVTPPETVFIWGRPKALQRVFDNIFTNANRHGDKIALRCDITHHDTDQDAMFVIEDNGEGVSEEQYKDIIKPFYRGETSRNMKTGGVGLGLAIAYDIVTAHGGTLAFDKSETLGGLKIKVILPL
jgi:two-component system osmolarity sensor histidine kinase EnvZ